MREDGDDLIEGLCCSWCGTFFEQEHGYPVICEYCYKEYKKEYKKEPEISKATEKEG